MDELQSQVKLIKAQVNILEVAYLDGYISVIYEFPYRVNGDRYWSKQVAFFEEFGSGESYKKLAGLVLALRKELED